MNKNCILKIVIILMLLSAIEPANAWSWGGQFESDNDRVSENLKIIELKAESWNQNQRIMKFLNRNMFEQGVNTIEISILNNDKIIGTYYIVRAQDIKGTATITKSVPEDTGVLWKFKPTIKQLLNGFDQASKAFSIMEQKEKSKSEIVVIMINIVYLYYTVDSENVPALSQLIKNSSCKQCKKALSWAGVK